MSSVSDGYSTTYSVKTITQKWYGNNAVHHAFTHESAYYQSPRNAPPSVSSDSGSGEMREEDRLLIDSVFLPEEWYRERFEGNYIYYFPKDSSFCYQSPSYKVSRDVIINNLYLGGAVEPTFPAFHFKRKLGTLHIVYGGNGLNGPVYTHSLYGAKKMNQACDSQNEILSIQKREDSDVGSVFVYPIPAVDMLQLSIARGSKPRSIGIFDRSGKLVQTLIPREGLQTVHVGALSPGVYFVKVTNEASAVTKKIVILR